MLFNDILFPRVRAEFNAECHDCVQLQGFYHRISERCITHHECRHWLDYIDLNWEFRRFYDGPTSVWSILMFTCMLIVWYLTPCLQGLQKVALVLTSGSGSIDFQIGTNKIKIHTLESSLLQKLMIYQTSEKGKMKIIVLYRISLFQYIDVNKVWIMNTFWRGI